MNEYKYPLISIIVHNYKGLKRLNNCLTSLYESDYPNLEVIVVDGLTKGIRMWLKKYYPNAKLIHFDHDLGIPHRLNSAYNHVDKNSKYVGFIAEDMEFHKKWLKNLVIVMENNPLIGIASPILLNIFNRHKVDSGGYVLDVLGYPDKQYSGFPLKYINNEIRAISYAEIMLIRRDVIDKCVVNKELFDSDYFMHYFDVDLCWRVQLAGYKVVMVPDSIIYHERRLTSGRSKLHFRNIFFNTRNQFITLIKNYHLLNVIRYLPLLLIFKLVEILILSFSRKEHSQATIKGIISLFPMFKSIILKRYQIQKILRRVPDHQLSVMFKKPNILQKYRSYRKHYHFN